MLIEYFQKNRLKTIFLLLFIAVVIGVSTVGNVKGSVLLPAIDDYSVTGKFAIRETYPIDINSLESVNKSYPNIPLWGSWVGSDANTGKIVSSEFVAPDAIQIFLAGYPSKSQINIYLENSSTKEKISLEANDSGEKWISKYWILPTSWKGNTIRLVAIDDDRDIGGWVGLSSPIAISWLSIIQSQRYALILPLTYTFVFTLWLLPGISLLIVTNLSKKISSLFNLSISLLSSALISYVIFWIYFVNHNLGRTISISVFATSLIYFTIQYKQYIKFVRDRDFQIPCLIMFLVGLLYLCILYIPDSHTFFNQYIASTRFFFARPGDNLIPQEFAERIYSGGDVRNTWGDWLSSDRPPLQSGIVLMARPIIDWYQVLGTIAQVSCITSIWTLCRVIKLTEKKISIVLGFAVFSGFLLYNSLYVWPKLLAASLVILAISLIMYESKQDNSAQGIYLSKISLGCIAVSLALGMLAHTGVFFTIIGLVIIFVAKGDLNPLRQPKGIAFSMAIFLLIYSPWIAYQKLYDPPGDRLVKMHFAGVSEVDKRSFSEAIIDSYQSITIQEVVKRRLENIKTLIGLTEVSIAAIHSPNPALIEDAQNIPIIMWRTADREFLGRALGILNIGWLPLFFKIFIKKRRKDKANTQVLTLLYVSLLGTLSAALLYFYGNATVITHLSYADILLLFIVLPVEITKLSKLLAYVLLIFQLIYLSVIWLSEAKTIPLNTLGPPPNFVLSFLGFTVFLCLVKLFIKLQSTNSHNKEARLSV